MFEKIVLRQGTVADTVTAGQLAEALLFYRSVHLVLDPSSICGLINAIGASAFIDVLKRPDVSSTFVDGAPGTRSNQIGPMVAHSFDFISLSTPSEISGKAKAGKRTPYDVLPAQLVRGGVKNKDAEKVTLALRSRVPVRPLGGTAFSDVPIAKLTISDLSEQAFLHEAVRTILRTSLPAEAIPTNFDLRLQDSDLGFYLLGNLNFEALEALRKAKFPATRPVTAGHVLSAILGARVDLTLAAHYGADFATSSLSSDLIRSRFDQAMVRSRLHKQEIEHFQEVVLEDAPSLAEAIDSGSRSFVDFVRVLDRSARFKAWAGGVHPDRGVVADYLKEVTKQDWIQGGPAKVIRYVMGLVLPEPVGTAWGVLDTFGLDKLLGNWRPNHFVEKQLKPFVQPDGSAD